MQLLISRGANVDARTPCGYTSLHTACQHGDTKIAKLLLDNGADPNITDGQNSPLLTACEGRHTKIARLLLENGADPNLVGTFSYPLKEAILRRELRMVELLLEHKADPNIDQGAILRLAIDFNEADIFQALIDAGADVSRKTLDAALDAAYDRANYVFSEIIDEQRRTMKD